MMIFEYVQTREINPQNGKMINHGISECLPNRPYWFDIPTFLTWLETTYPWSNSVVYT